MSDFFSNLGKLYMYSALCDYRLSEIIFSFMHDPKLLERNNPKDKIAKIENWLHEKDKTALQYPDEYDEAIQNLSNLKQLFDERNKLAHSGIYSGLYHGNDRDINSIDIRDVKYMKRYTVRDSTIKDWADSFESFHTYFSRVVFIINELRGHGRLAFSARIPEDEFQHEGEL